jgi:Zn-dependent protease/CBS domain-containing protein
MGWSWKIGKLAGIDLYMHATFALLIVWVGVSSWFASRSMADMAESIGFILALFGCVVLHELGHALMARRYGIPTRDITLLPIGGVARLERMPDDPRQELAVAAAGPLVNVVIAAILLAVITLGHLWQPLEQVGVAQGSILQRLLIANIWLVLFNLIPAFPMDGGRILRALLATRMPYLRATQIAAGLGQGFAFLFGFAGLFYNPLLVFIALFVWIGAAEEAAATQMRVAFAGTPVQAAMITDFRTLTTTSTLGDGVRLVLDGHQQDFPVVNETGEIAGMLLRSDLLAGLSLHGADYPVTSVMRTNCTIATSTDMLEGVFRKLSQEECRTVPVIDGGRFRGLVTMDNVAEFFMIQNALQKKPS